MDDIVTRLRELADSVIDKTDERFQSLMQAANEIERLREWKELAYQMRNKYWWCMRKKTLIKFDKMHNSDWALPKNVLLRAQLHALRKKDMRNA